MQHDNLSNGAWADMPFAKQMANIGSETYRATKWLAKGRRDNAEKAFERMQELIDLTIAYGRHGQPNRKALLKELCRFRELYCGAFLDGDLDTLSALNRYLDHFAHVNCPFQVTTPSSTPPQGSSSRRGGSATARRGRPSAR